MIKKWGYDLFITKSSVDYKNHSELFKGLFSIKELLLLFKKTDDDFIFNKNFIPQFTSFLIELGYCKDKNTAEKILVQTYTNGLDTSAFVPDAIYNEKQKKEIQEYYITLTTILSYKEDITPATLQYIRQELLKLLSITSLKSELQIWRLKKDQVFYSYITLRSTLSSYIASVKNESIYSYTPTHAIYTENKASFEAYEEALKAPYVELVLLWSKQGYDDEFSQYTKNNYLIDFITKEWPQLPSTYKKEIPLTICKEALTENIKNYIAKTSAFSLLRACKDFKEIAAQTLYIATYKNALALPALDSSVAYKKNQIDNLHTYHDNLMEIVHSNENLGEEIIAYCKQELAAIKPHYERTLKNQQQDIDGNHQKENKNTIDSSKKSSQTPLTQQDSNDTKAPKNHPQQASHTTRNLIIAGVVISIPTVLILGFTASKKKKKSPKPLR